MHNQHKRFEPSHALRLFADVLAGVVSVHASNQLRLDLKSDNVLLSKNHDVAKLADFGTARQQRETLRATKLDVTPRWCAPEAFGAVPNLTYAADVWSCGMILLELASGKLPYNNLKENHQVFGAIGWVPITVKIYFGDCRIERGPALFNNGHQISPSPSRETLYHPIESVTENPSCSM